MNFNSFTSFPFPVPPPPFLNPVMTPSNSYQRSQNQSKNGHDARAEELGISPADLDEHILGCHTNDAAGNTINQTDAEPDNSFRDRDVEKAYNKTKTQLKYKKKRDRRKQQKAAKYQIKDSVASKSNKNGNIDASDVTDDKAVVDVSVEYVQEDFPLDRADPSYAYFKRISHHFKLMSNASEIAKAEKKNARATAASKPRVRDRTQLEEEKEDIVKDNEADKHRISKKQLKKMTRLSVAELKQLVIRPDVVEMHDVTATDPKLLVLLKSTRNTVPVPRHWSGKRKYLQGKRGFVKPPFDLPDFIKRTGIMEMRQSLLDKDDHKSLKQKMRERIRPKLGKIEIDYQKLHDAFFKYQTKPRMSIHGDLYYEGKENEIKLRQKKPGQLSDELRAALGMPIGSASDKIPPPWLIAMQRYGPPPSYPNLKIPGLNAPIPEGCSFGYHAGGWGKPPVDEMGRPLYGDVFGCSGGISGPGGEDIDLHVDRTLWGELESDEENELESDGDSDSGQIVDMTMSAGTQLEDGDDIQGTATPSGVVSAAPSALGLETPADHIEIRKRTTEASGDASVVDDSTGQQQAQQLYHVLTEKSVTVGTSIMGSSKVYDVSAAVQPTGKRTSAQPSSGGPGKPNAAIASNSVDIALEPDELEMDSDILEKRYKEQMQNELSKNSDDDDESGHRSSSNRRKKRQRHSSGSRYAGESSGTSSQSKRNKSFKF
ncbi:hypothetical protein GJ496_007206 [Pomphorhynchus laevis]|nr:hypothetical protein GJ496_007206 [Pomphorhynchus laevis]